MEVDQVRVLLLGDRGFPLADARVPKHMVGDVNGILELIHEHQPDFTVEDLLRAVWRMGVGVALRQAQKQVVFSR